MREDEIKNGIQLMNNASKEISKCYMNKNALIDKLNSLSYEELAPVEKYYKSKSGVIVDLRKEVLEYLLAENKLDEETLEGLILKHRTGKEKQYKSYQNPFSIFFPLITLYGHNPHREFITQFIDEIIERLQLKGKVKHKFVDFQGARQLGSDRSWLAIYNGKQKSQSTGLQLFVDFNNGKIKYGVYRYPGIYINGPVERDSATFDFESMISLFEEHKESILKDEPVKDKLLTIPLEDNRLFKISHGSFNTNNEVLEIIAENNWIIIHETTNKGPTELFKNELNEGDYLYISIGNDELLSIVKVKSGSWKYVPEDVVNEDGWLYREVEYIKSAIKPDSSDLKEYTELIYPRGNSTLTEIDPEKLDEANDRIFKPHFGVEFVSGKTKSQRQDGNLKEFPCNIILYGPPGTGKTYRTIDLAVEIIKGNKASHQENKEVFDVLRKEGQIEFITFHQNYSYEDFLIGIRPDLDEASTLKFRRREGIFYSMCKRAEQNYLQSQNQTEVSLNRYVLIIDEINRANISKVFGELITLLEEDKRIGAKNELRVSIPGEKAYFGIPPNVYVIGTMNTADKSIAMIDIALRRRFEFIGYFPDYNKVDELSGDILKHVNTEIYNRKKSADYLIGHGYFMNGDEPPETSKVLENKVIPLLMEYFSGKTEVVEEIFKGSEWSVKYDTEKYGWEIKQQLKQ
ncbi:McrB family protein [Methanosarcina sp.]|uniref:McrB family protein n=1 Tax=Methanosarcina sp. TaxID=2213 RepID=UPI002ABA89B1|nr:AAA family ATPase [Methanosarcina sp.]MDY9925720.1 AAA family ATPase [Methanosarcina sp.]